MVETEKNGSVRKKVDDRLSSHAGVLSNRMLDAAASGKWRETANLAHQVLELDQDNAEAAHVLTLAEAEAKREELGTAAAKALCEGQFDDCLGLCDQIEGVAGNNGEQVVCSPAYVGSTSDLRKLVARHKPEFEKLLEECRKHRQRKLTRRDVVSLTRALQIAPSHAEARDLHAEALRQCRRRFVWRVVIAATSFLVVAVAAVAAVCAIRVRGTVRMFEQAVDSGMHEKAALLAPEIVGFDRTAKDLLAAVDARAACVEKMQEQRRIIFGGKSAEFEKAVDIEAKADDLFSQGEYLLAGSKWSEAAAMCASVPPAARMRILFGEATEPPVKMTLVNSGGLTWTSNLVSGTSGQVLGVAGGDCVIRVAKEDHIDLERNLKLEPGKLVDLRVALAPCPGDVMVTCNVLGEVRIDGDLAGNTGEWLSGIPAGSRDVRVSTAGYRAAEFAVLVEPNSRKTQSVELARAMGELVVEVQWSPVIPVGYDFPAPVLKIADKVKRDAKFPVQGPVPVGEYAIDVIAAGFESDGAKQVTVRDGLTTTVSVRLDPKPATMIFECDVNVPVEIREGETAIGMAGERISLSPFDEHRLDFVAEGYKKKTMKVRVPRAGVFYKKPTQIALEPETQAAARE